MLTSLRTAALGALLAAGVGYSAIAEDLKFFTIGTGGTAYTY